MRDTTAIFLSGVLLTAGWGLATGYALRPLAHAWFEAAAAGDSAWVGARAQPARMARSDRAGREHCSSDYVCDDKETSGDQTQR